MGFPNPFVVRFQQNRRIQTYFALKWVFYSFHGYIDLYLPYVVPLAFLEYGEAIFIQISMTLFNHFKN